MQLTRKQMEEIAGISTNLATVWLREGVLKPLETLGRNRRFSRDEATIACIVASIHGGISAPSWALVGVADWLRREIFVGTEHGFTSWRKAKAAVDLERLIQWQQELRTDSDPETSSSSLNNWATKLGFSLNNLPPSKFTREQSVSLDQWADFMSCLESDNNGWLTFAYSEKEGWFSHFNVADPVQLPRSELRKVEVFLPPAGFEKFTVINLSEVFTN